MMKKILWKALAVVLLSSVCYGDYYTEGQVAYDKKDYKKAWNLMNKSCDSGDARGCGMIGAYYEDGIVVSRNLNKALEYYDNACGMGNNWTCEHLPTLKAKMPVCSESEISFINDKRYFEVSSTADNVYPSILADSKTIQIDKKNKTIKVWTVWLASQKGRDETIKDFSKYYNYDNFGYFKSLDIINYGTMKSKRGSLSDSNCDGSIINSSNKSGEWQDIIPNSVLEGIMERIKKKYNLK